MLQLSGVRRENNGDKDKMTRIKNISEVTKPLKEEILKGDIHTIEEMRAWLQDFGYSDAIKDAAVKFVLREFVMREVSTDIMMNMDMVVDRLRPQMEVTKEEYRANYYHGIVSSSRLARIDFLGNLKMCIEIYNINSVK